MTDKTWTDIERLIGKVYADRGLAYARQGRVLGISVDRESGRISGRVEGSDRAAYVQQVALDWSATGRIAAINGDCSCPVGENCKHVAALLHAALPQLDRQARPSLAPAAPPAALSGAVQVWLRAAQMAVTQDEDYPLQVFDRIIYILSRRHERLVVQPWKGRITKDGSLGKSLARYGFTNMDSPTPPKYLRPLDRRIRRLLSLAGWYGGSEGWPLPEADEGSRTLAVIISTRRGRWETADSPALFAGPPLEGQFVWHTDAAGGQALRVETASGGQVTPLPVEPLWYLDAATGACGPLVTELPQDRALWLAKAPAVSAAEAAAMAEALQQLPGPALPLPRAIGQRLRRDVPPRLVVRLHGVQAQRFAPSDWRRHYGAAQLHKRMLPALSLSFDYDGQRVDVGSPAQSLDHFDGEQVQKILRDRRAESLHIKALSGFAEARGFAPARAVPPDVRLSPGQASDLVLWSFDAELGTGVEPALEFARGAAAHLADFGWRVEVDASWPCQLIEGDHLLTAGVAEAGDWFSLALNIEVAGKEIDLVPAVQQFLRHLPPEAVDAGFDLDGFLADRIFSLRLTDGRYLAMQARQLAPVLRIFLGVHGQLHLAEAGVAAEMAEALAGSSIAFRGGEKLLELGRRLRAFARPDMAPEPPPGFAGTLRPYQKTGLGWIAALGETGFGGVLADDMGLGKTVQALAFLAGRQGVAGLPSLLIAPTSVVGVWTREAARFAPHLRVLALQGPDRKALFSQIATHDLVVTTYPLLHRDLATLAAQDFDCVILDEAQAVKNPAAQAAKLIRTLKSRQRLALTGTPMENNLQELWALFDWLVPGLLGDRKAFQKRFRGPVEKSGDRAAQVLLSRRIAPFILRRSKDQVAPDLPPKTEVTEMVALSGAQRELYETIRIAMDQRVRDALRKKGLAGAHITVLDALLKLRQVCCDPALVKLPVAAEITASAKRSHLLAMLEELLSEGRRVLVFSQFVEMLRLIEADLVARGWTYEWLSGETKDREALVARFQAGSAPIFLISLKAGGVGLTLTAADTVILYDPWWNPAVERQAMDRTHRIGQDRPVFVYRLITEGTIEARIEAMQTRKQALADALFDPAHSGPAILSEAEILALFQPIAQNRD
ncbi:MAG: DEAD/DEAH box helicase [Gemmobacter sp.]